MYNFLCKQRFGITLPDAVLPHPSAASYQSAPQPQSVQPQITFKNNVKRVKSRGFFACRHEYTGEALLQSWLVCRQLSLTRADLPKLIGLISDLISEPGIADIVKGAVADKSLMLPSQTTLQRTANKVNTLDLLYQRQLHSSLHFARYCSPDSSRQGQHNFYVVLEDRISWPLDATPEVRLQIDVNKNLEERALPTTTLGLGASGEVWKSANTHHAIGIETGSWDNFVIRCKSSIGCVISSVSFSFGIHSFINSDFK